MEIPNEFFEILQWRKWLDYVNEVLSYYEDIRQPNPKMLNSPYLFSRWVDYARAEYKKKVSGDKSRPMFDDPNISDWSIIDDTVEEWEIEMGEKVWTIIVEGE